MTVTAQDLHARAWVVATTAMNDYHASQRHDELTQALIVTAREVPDPRVIVEIGCDAGGTLYCWRNMFPTALVVGVTLMDNSPATGGQAYPLTPHGATVVRGDSHDPRMVPVVRKVIGSKPVDVLFIDGDHTAAGIKADIDLWFPLVRAGGLILFHDVANASCPDAVAAWDDIKGMRQRAGEWFEEIVSSRHRPAGFGIVRHGTE